MSDLRFFAHNSLGVENTDLVELGSSINASEDREALFHDATSMGEGSEEKGRL